MPPTRCMTERTTAYVKARGQRRYRGNGALKISSPTPAVAPARHPDISQPVVARMKHVLRHPQNRVPQPGRAFIPQFVKPDRLQVEVAGDQPCLRLVGPLLVIAQRK